MSHREITYTQAINEALREEMQRDERVFIMGEDIAEHGGPFGVTRDLWKEFGKKRVRNTPISEAAIVGAGIGAALCGLRPVVEIMFIDFATLAMDQIVNQAAKLRYMSGGMLKVPIVIRTQGGGGRGNAAQHSQSLEAWFVHIPGLKVIMPSTPYDAKGLLKAAIRDDNPVVFIEHKLLYPVKGPVPEEEYVLPIGVADIKRHGDDVTIVATSRMVLLAMEAAARLQEEGISVEVVDPRTLKPLDIDTIVNSVQRTGRAVVVVEGHRTCGFASELATRIMEKAFDYLDAPIQIVAGKDVPIPYAQNLERAALPQVEDIISAVKSIL
ncbi:MAG: alpha-ketoacid dehydrogenase subunit beta [Anaerolineae bacterium]|nr:alpha-ketoacid dehydrogenase subunit beta [Synergistota bacterium]MDW8103225.1 alpha-ketoacid dehydrogenase subunit beta [Anaerolineae bacterium]MDW8193189.1 alpha-ketoacid dehydrogenase subunit beta [Synergistota bacterium]